MPVDIIVGTQWGDEGKGRITDLLAGTADIVARYGGGDNAGHSVTVGDTLFKLHLLPSGVIQPHTKCLLGSGMVLNPAKLIEELEKLESFGVDISPERVLISQKAHLITPLHLILDGAEEKQRANGQLGTTRRGIGPAYTDKISRKGIRIEEIREPDRYRRHLEQHLQFADSKVEVHSELQELDPVQAVESYMQYGERLLPYLADTEFFLHNALREGQGVLAEGAQGTLLDIDFGTYPYVTSSHPISAGALLGLGIGPQFVRKVIGVTKSFQTRVGAGPFPTELKGEIADRLRGTGQHPWDEFGTTTGRPRRCGWLDAVLLRYAVRINGITEIALTKLDILSGISELSVCTSYRHEHGSAREYPADLPPLATLIPDYEELPGWEANIHGVRTWDDLPTNARKYVTFLEDQCGVRIRWISVGPERNQMIERPA